MNIFENLKLDGEIKTEVLSTGCSLGVSGSFRLSRGIFTQEFSWWGNVYESRYKGYLTFDDYDIDLQSTYLGDVRVDNLSKFRDSLKNSGLNTLSSQFEFSDNEKDSGMYTALKSNKMIDVVFEGNKGFFRLLSEIEQTIIKLTRVINNYDTVGDYDKVDATISKDYKVIPTLEELIELRNQLIHETV